MSIKEITERLEFAARYIEGKTGKAFLLGEFDVKALRAAIALLRTHPDAQPNEPLTLEELRDLHGKPVWLHRPEDGQGWWSVVRIGDTMLYTDYGAWCDLREYGKTWVTYRRPPKEA